MTKEEIIAALKDTCVILHERKAQFELVIHALERKDDDAEDDEAERDKEVEDEDGSGNEDEEDEKKGEEEASGNSSEAAE
jgi:hypothetical protein